MEWLGHLISSEISIEMNQAIVLKEILNQFCTFFGHKISARKSNMFFAKRVEPV